MSLDYYRKAYQQGREAAENGWERTSPYTGVKAEQYWYAGYDNISFDDFHRFVRESRRAVKSNLGYSRIGLNNI